MELTLSNTEVLYEYVVIYIIYIHRSIICCFSLTHQHVYHYTDYTNGILNMCLINTGAWEPQSSVKNVLVSGTVAYYIDVALLSDDVYLFYYNSCVMIKSVYCYT